MAVVTHSGQIPGTVLDRYGGGAAMKEPVATIWRL